METPSYIKALLKPNGRKPAGRKVWSIDLEMVWLPFFTATNTAGDTRIPHDALGAPLRLAYNADSTVKFSKSGRPVTKVATDLADNIRMVRDNFTAGLLGYANGVITENPDGYKAEIELARKAGAPIVTRDRENLDRALADAMAEAVAEAMDKADAETEAVDKAETEVKDKPKRKARELVHA